MPDESDETSIEGRRRSESNSCTSEEEDNKAVGIDKLRRTYQRTARWAAGTCRSAPALEKLRWPPWDQRRKAMQEMFAMRVWEDARPASLRELLPSTTAPLLSTRIREKGEVWGRQPHREIGKKCFSVWGPQTISTVHGEMPNESDETSIEGRRRSESNSCTSEEEDSRSGIRRTGWRNKPFMGT